MTPLEALIANGMIEALRPFEAALTSLEKYAPNEPDNAKLSDLHVSSLRVGDLRRARAALEAGGLTGGQSYVETMHDGDRLLRSLTNTNFIHEVSKETGIGFFKVKRVFTALKVRIALPQAPEKSAIVLAMIGGAA